METQTQKKDSPRLDRCVKATHESESEVRTNTHQHTTVERNKVQFAYRNRSELEDSEDFMALPNLDEVLFLWDSAQTSKGGYV